MILFFDTETTGKADFNAKLDAPHQPRIVQIAALLTDDDGQECSHFNAIIRPDGFTIPEGAARIHGITTERALAVGIGIREAMTFFQGLALHTKTYAAHNIDFDRLLVNSEFLRSNIKWLLGPEDCFCTMKAMTPVCKLPGVYDDWKWPKLVEAHQHAFGCGFEKAHDALADVRACAKIYFWLKAQQSKTPPTEEKSAP